MRRSEIERRYRARLRELWTEDDESDTAAPRRRREERGAQEEAARIGAAIPRLRRLSSGRRHGERRSGGDRRALPPEHEADRECEAPIDEVRARSVLLRFKAEERLRLIEQRVEEAARQRGRQRGRAEGSAQVAAVLDQAEEVLAELSEVRRELRSAARREAVELAVQMTRRLLALDLVSLPPDLATGFEAWIEREAGRLGEAVVLRIHPSMRELLEAMAVVREGQVRLELDPHAPPRRIRILGSAGAAELDPDAGLESMAAAMRAAVAPGDEAGEP